MKRILLAIAATVFLSLGVSGNALADCTAAPVGSTSDMGISFLATNGTQVGPTTELLSSVKEGVLVYDSAAKKIKICDGTNWVGIDGGSSNLTAKTPVLVSGAIGVIITDGNQLTSAAFDGNLSQTSAASAGKTGGVTSWYIGKSFAGPYIQPVYKAIVRGSSDIGYSSGSIGLTFNLRGKAAAPAPRSPSRTS